MPTYEYLCNECENSFEAVQSFSEATIDKCPKCGGEVRKLYSNVGVVFKGSGFYKTDSRTKPAAKSESKPEVNSKKKEAPEKKEK